MVVLLLLLGQQLRIIDVAPFLFKALLYRDNTPAGFFADAVKDGEDFFLFGARGHAFSHCG